MTYKTANSEVRVDNHYSKTIIRLVASILSPNHPGDVKAIQRPEI
jgi:hypothetical protein